MLYIQIRLIRSFARLHLYLGHVSLSMMYFQQAKETMPYTAITKRLMYLCCIISAGIPAGEHMHYAAIAGIPSF